MKAKLGSVQVILKIYFLVLCIYTLFRGVLFWIERDRLGDGEGGYNIARSFIMGVRFDVVVAGYIMILPALVLFILDILNKQNRLIIKLLFIWIFTLFTISFAICAADIPYFHQFFERFTVGAFMWADNPMFVLSMILEEPQYAIYILLFVILELVFYFSLKKIFKNIIFGNEKIFLKIPISLIMLALIFLGIRGRVEAKSPIRVGTAYFCTNPLLNKLGLNPSFTLIQSYLSQKSDRNVHLDFMSDDKAEKIVHKYLQIDSSMYQAPLARKSLNGGAAIHKENVVLIIMESMSAAKMGIFGNQYNLTPFLDSLSQKSLFFENAFSAGKHTFNGIFSSLFSYPAIYRQHTMKEIKPFDGIQNAFLANNYSTTYFTTHDGQFDNVEGFLRANGFQNIITESNYPSQEVKTTLGVPDDYMFRFSIPIINDLAKSNKPFFVSFMTASDHGPFYIPSYFKPKNKIINQQIVEYADWSLKQFFTMAQKQSWYNNTLFVLVADHGANINPQYDIPMNYFHVPLIFFSPNGLVSPQNEKKLASQIDIVPTIMGILNLPYINNTYGIDLIHQNRPYTLINDDDKIGVVDTTHLCIIRDNLALYDYKHKNKQDLSQINATKTHEMAEYGKAFLQYYQYLIKNNKTIIDSK
ncbi:alkaline phosphatase family protein [Ornithobacterium rhinotracheale]|uniref:LTA synthase family protein n=1 Tax=Ornithobacterium rhinotracheale TaxID=28251 RepID=UPI00129CB182|nr:alkaline phosphatase family protein [Ornithobacterium rhinotracheale]MRJ08616.1 alkaline phosphatase family protein [Ornithobacterium rhinotracheale]UOH76938.1 sulfatase-like hydrolase/transferase [Ornithobacterium rhinotracheale]